MMKKKLFAVLALCLGLGLPVAAENTDVTTIDNTLYIEPLTANVGKTVTLSIKMKNTVKVEGLQFTLVLPKGLQVVTEPDTAVYVSRERTDSSSVYGVETALPDSTTLMVLIGSHERKAFTGTDGEVATVKVQVAKGTAPGTYPLYLRNIALSDDQEIPASYDTAEVESSITLDLRGDVNRDGEVGIGDIVAVTNIMAGTDEAGYDGDVNDDGEVGIGDIVSITNIMAGVE